MTFEEFFQHHFLFFSTCAALSRTRFIFLQEFILVFKYAHECWRNRDFLVLVELYIGVVLCNLSKSSRPRSCIRQISFNICEVACSFLPCSIHVILVYLLLILESMSIKSFRWWYTSIFQLQYWVLTCLPLWSTKLWWARYAMTEVSTVFKGIWFRIELYSCGVIED